MFTDCTVDYNDSKSILGFQLESIVEIILVIEGKRKWHNDLFRDFKYFIKKSSFITINHKINSIANAERNNLSLVERGELGNGIVNNLFIDENHRISIIE